MQDIERLAGLLAERNKIDGDIAALIGRPAHTGHIGEFVASRIFGVELEHSATNRGYDGRFSGGLLAGRTVNVKLYGKNEGIIDINLAALPEYFLVLTGPRTPPASSRLSTRPLVISEVYLFETARLVAALSERRVRIGIATSVRREYWDESQMFPIARNPVLILDEGQRRLLSLFAPM